MVVGLTAANFSAGLSPRELIRMSHINAPPSPVSFAALHQLFLRLPPLIPPFPPAALQLSPVEGSVQQPRGNSQGFPRLHVPSSPYRIALKEKASPALEKSCSSHAGALPFPGCFPCLTSPSLCKPACTAQ